MATLSPSLNWGDGARLQLDISLGGSNYWFLPELINSPLDTKPFARLGVAPWDHPLYVLIGQAALAIPIRDPLWRLNFLSALAAAATVAMLFRVGVRIGAAPPAAALGAAALALSHTFWFHAVTTEVLALHSLFMVALILLALRWTASHRARDLYAFAFVAGLGLANHLMLSLTLLALIPFLFLSARDAAVSVSRRTLLLFAVLLVVGFAPWLVQFVRVVRVIGLRLTYEGIMWFPHGARPMATASWLDDAPPLLTYAGWLLYQFTPVGLLLAGIGFRRLRRTGPDVAWLLGILFLIHVRFSLSIPISDRYAFHLPSYVILACFIALGAQAISDRVVAWRGERWRPVAAMALAMVIVLPLPILYARIPQLLR